MYVNVYLVIHISTSPTILLQPSISQMTPFSMICVWFQTFVAPYRAFTITAIAQLCILGTMWIFGCFQFDEGMLATSYIFTILNSLQGVLVFIMHCLLSKQVSLLMYSWNRDADVQQKSNTCNTCIRSWLNVAYITNFRTALGFAHSATNRHDAAKILFIVVSLKVRDEYIRFLTCLTTPQKSSYSEFSTNQSSKSQVHSCLKPAN